MGDRESASQSAFERNAGKIITSVLAALILAIGVTGVSVRDTAIANSSALEDIKEAIGELSDRDDTLEAKFASARVDPYTGSEGRAVESRVTRLEVTTEGLRTRLDRAIELLEEIRTNGAGRYRQGEGG